jgi:uncharacterized iron-regulated membrane protein
MGRCFCRIAAFTGILIGFESGERAICAVTRSSPPVFTSRVGSAPPAGVKPIDADQAIQVAQASIGDTSVAGLVVPLAAKAVWTVLLRVPEDTSETVHSSVTIDQYSGHALLVPEFPDRFSGLPGDPL